MRCRDGPIMQNILAQSRPSISISALRRLGVYQFLANVRYMSSSVRLSSVVCRLSVTFVHPTPTIEIFGNVSTPFDMMAIY